MMQPKVSDRHFLSALFAVVAWQCEAQTRATCLYSETFASPGLPADWVGLPAQVERLDADGNSTGEFIAPWQVGDAAQAAAGGYFPVPDEPMGNTFAMANDDAPPCDCAMSDLSLFSPFIDLSTTTAPALSYRIYHDGRPFNEQASLWASLDGSTWTMLDQIPAVLGEWQQRTIDLSAYASGQVQLRFRYDDGGHWASGLAVDDVCVFDRLSNDVALSSAWLGDATSSAFNTSVRSLGYSRMPIEQQSALRLSARIRNNGTAPASDLRMEASISVDGGTPTVITTTVAASLAPLTDTLVWWDTGSLVDEPGEVTITLTLLALDQDEDTSDNAAALGFIVTSADEGNNTMALDNDVPVSICGTDDGFSAGCRYEMLGTGSVVRGISVRFGGGTVPGSRVHALLMDGTLNLLSSSASHTVSEEDMALSFAGGLVYIPLDSSITVSDDQDLLALVRCLPDSGTLRIACGGTVPEGAALVIDAQDFLISYPSSAPIIRLHLSDPVTGLSSHESPLQEPLHVYPNPAHGPVMVRVDGHPVGLRLEVLNADGRIVFRGSSGTNSPALLSTGGWSPGVYCVRAWWGNGMSSARLVVD